MNHLFRKAIPPALLAARYKLKRLGPVRFAAYRRLEREEGRKPAPAAGKPFELDGGSFLLHSDTVHSVRSHWVDYGHGIEELRAFKRLAPEHRVMLDIGAAEGIFSAAFCALTGGKAWAFEPSPDMFERLQNLRRVNPDLAIDATNVALGASAGDRPVKQYSDGQFSAVGAGATDPCMVVTTLDGFAAEHAVEPDFAKIDVEGMELDVLQGGERTFRGPVRTLVIEVHYEMLAAIGHSLTDLQTLLEDYGFGLESLEATRIVDLASFALARPEHQPGYTIVVGRKREVWASERANVGARTSKE